MITQLSEEMDTDETGPAAPQEELDVAPVPAVKEKESVEMPSAPVNPNCPCARVLNGTNFCGLCNDVLPQLEKFQRSKTAIQQKMEQLQETLSLFVSEKANYLKKIVVFSMSIFC